MAKEEEHAAPAVEASPAPAAEGRARRERKQVEAYKPEVKAKDEFVIKPGHGSKLGDIPNVKFKIGKHKPDDEIIVDLHRVLFNRAGVATKRKKDIQEFSGFVWEADKEEKEKEKATERVSKLTQAALTSICDILDLSKDGKKEEKAHRIVDFLLAPKATSDKDLAAAEAKKKEAKKRQREKAKTKTPASKSKGKKKAKKAGSEEGEDDEDDDHEEEEDEEKEEAEEEEEDQPAPKKAKAEQKPKGKPGRKPAAKGKAKAEAAEAGVDEAADEVAEQEEGDTGDGGTGASPTDDELRDAVRIIVKDVDAASYTLKSLMVELKSRFPAVDLTSRKQAVKAWLIECLQEPAVGKDASAQEGDGAGAAETAEIDEAKAMDVEPAEAPAAKAAGGEPAADEAATEEAAAEEPAAEEPVAAATEASAAQPPAE